MTKYKKLTKSRAITIPKDLSAKTGIFGGTAVDMTISDGGILITKHIPTCHYCGSADTVRLIKGDEICIKCAEEIRKEIMENYA